MFRLKLTAVIAAVIAVCSTFSPASGAPSAVNAPATQCFSNAATAPAVPYFSNASCGSCVSSACGGACAYVSSSSASVWRGGDVFAGCGEKAVALTFDDGPHPHITDKILAVLEKYGVKATFFEIGRNVRLYPEVTSRVIAAGHEVGNHTDSHAFLRGFSTEHVENEIMSADDAISDVCEYETHFLRPPGGIYDSAVVEASSDEEKVIALWTIDTLDWNHRSCKGITDEVLTHVKGGDIILMHDYVSGESHTVEALEIIIPELLSRGYTFVTLSDMYLNWQTAGSGG